MFLCWKNRITMLSVALRTISPWVLMLFLFPIKSHAVDVSLTWDSSVGASGYRVYYGNQSGNYSLNINVGNQTSYTLSDTSLVGTYYFAVTAYAPGTAESGFSNEVVANIPNPPPGGTIDSDNDGVPDDFEIQNGLDPNDSSDCPSWICGPSSGGWRSGVYQQQ